MLLALMHYTFTICLIKLFSKFLITSNLSSLIKFQNSRQIVNNIEFILMMKIFTYYFASILMYNFSIPFQI